MIVVSDTTAITNLFQIGRLNILRGVFGQVVIPEAVFEELSELSAQKQYLINADWIEIQSIEDSELIQNLKKRLDEGESEAIALAVKIRADFLVMDEWKGRRIAQEMGLQIIGIVGILTAAKRKSIILEVKPILDELIEMVGFRIHPSIYAAALKDSGE